MTVLNSLALLEADTERPLDPPHPLALGRVIGFVDGLQPLVVVSEAHDAPAVAARTTVPLGADDLGSDVVVWLPGRAQTPIVVGRVLGGSGAPKPSVVAQVSVDVDGDRILLTATRSISLRCGKASVTLTSDGSVIIEGARVTSRSIGINRITGAAVHIN